MTFPFALIFHALRVWNHMDHHSTHSGTIVYDLEAGKLMLKRLDVFGGAGIGDHMKIVVPGQKIFWFGKIQPQCSVLTV